MQKNCIFFKVFCFSVCLPINAIATTCDTGYTATNITAKSVDFGGCVDNGFTRYDTPNFDLYYIIPDNPSNSRYVQGSCDSDEYSVIVNLSMGQIGGKCTSSYTQLYVSDGRNIDVISDSISSYAQGSCPNGFYDATTTTGLSVSTLSEGLCQSGYTEYSFEDMCRGSNTSVYTCPLLCESGGEYTDLGTCGSYCTAFQANLLHFGDKAARLWSTKQNVTNKSINVGTPNGGVCYANLVVGEKSGTLNLIDNGVIYHVVDLIKTGENQ